MWSGGRHESASSGPASDPYRQRRGKAVRRIARHRRHLRRVAVAEDVVAGQRDRVQVRQAAGVAAGAAVDAAADRLGLAVARLRSSWYFIYYTAFFSAVNSLRLFLNPLLRFRLCR